MTSPALDQKALAAALMPCPLCGEHLQLATDPRMKGMLEHPASGCPISACCFLDTPDLRAAWNRRASLPAPEPVATQYRYRHKSEGAIWTEWDRHNPALSSYGDYEFEERPLYASPPSHQGLREALERIASGKFYYHEVGHPHPSVEMARAALQSQPAPSGETK